MRLELLKSEGGRVVTLVLAEYQPRGSDQVYLFPDPLRLSLPAHTSLVYTVGELERLADERVRHGAATREPPTTGRRVAGGTYAREHEQHEQHEPQQQP